jgi:hypothetical protein
MRVAYVDSPLQVFNLIELQNGKGSKIDVLLLNKNTKVSAGNYAQMEGLLPYLSIGKLVLLDFYPAVKAAWKIRAAVRMALAELELGKLDSATSLDVVCGEYRSLFFWSLIERISRHRAASIVVVDDGTASLRINRKEASGKTAKDHAKWLATKMAGLSADSRYPVSFFSVYDLSKKIGAADHFIPNRYQNYRDLIARLPPNDSEIFVVGSPLREAGVVEGDDIPLTMDLIRNIRGDFPGRHLVYVPHRRERKEKLDAISELVEVRRQQYPFEVLSLIQGKRLTYIAGFYSSVFDNMQAIHGKEIHIASYRLPSDAVARDWRDFVRSVYENYALYPSDAFSIRG